MSSNVTKKKSGQLEQKRKNRRRIIISLIEKGLTHEDMLSELKAKGHDVTLRTVQRDFSDLQEIIGKEMGTDTHAVTKVLTEFMIRNSKTYRETWKLYEENDDPKIKTRCLELLNKMNHDTVKIAQSMGLVKQAPISIEHTGQISVKQTLELIRTVNIQEMKKLKENDVSQN